MSAPLSADRTSLCWKCSKQEGFLQSPCPHCGATNPNVDLQAALKEQADQGADLVSRLRKPVNWLSQAAGSWKDGVSEYNRTPYEAADEIERLRRGEYICSRCGIRKDGEGEHGDF